MICYLYPAAEEEFVSQIKEMPEAESVRFSPYGSESEIEKLAGEDIDHLIISGTLSSIKKAMLLCRKYDISMGIVPMQSQSRLAKILDLPSRKTEAFLTALLPADKKTDMFFCNENLVLDDVRIGHASLLKEFEYDYLKYSFLQRASRLWRSFRKKSSLRHYSFSVKTEKGDVKRFSAVGIIALDYDKKSWIASALGSYLGSGDGKHVLAILSPRSLWQFFVAQPLDILFGAKGGRKLPRSLGFIKESHTVVEADEPVEVIVDDYLSMQTPVELRTDESALALSVGENFWHRQSSVKSPKGNIKLDNIPKDSESIKYLSRGLPLFEHASQEQYSTLFAALREEGKHSGTFVMLLLLSTLMAVFGLFIDSSSVIIGAMLLAPLMQPIVSLSMGVLRQDRSMQTNAVKTIVGGILIVLATSALLAFLIPIQTLTSEMAGRLSPTILDLFVAMVSGVAAAYVKNNEKILSSLAGVAIAVALVPPLAVAGVGIGWWERNMFEAAFLLFATNLAGIVLSAALTFMALGYSPIVIARKGIFTWFFVVALIAVPLYSTFGQMRDNARIQRMLTHRYFDIGDKRVELGHVEVVPRKECTQIRCEVISNEMLSTKEKDRLRDMITKSVGRKVNIIAAFRYRL